MEVLIASLVSLFVGVGGGGYLGYKYGRKVEVKAQAIRDRLIEAAKTARG